MHELPGISVVIRTLDRPGPLCELLRAVRAQDYPDFEIVLVDQSRDLDPQQREAVARAADDPRVRRVPCPRLGPAHARNVGWRAASKPVVLFMDDDDLPLGDGWLAAHGRNYRDPDVVGVSGREVHAPGERCGYRLRWLARRACLSYGVLGTPYVYCRLDERVDPVAWLHGGNASVRRAVIEAVGGWDPRYWDHEEHSLCLALPRVLRPGQRLVFDPAPSMLRRKDVPGGLSRRAGSAEQTFRRAFLYYHRLIPQHRPRRFRALYPVYLLVPLASTLRWIWRDSTCHGGLSRRLWGSLTALARWPAWHLRARRAARRGDGPDEQAPRPPRPSTASPRCASHPRWGRLRPAREGKRA